MLSKPVAFAGGLLRGGPPRSSSARVVQDAPPQRASAAAIRAPHGPSRGGSFASYGGVPAGPSRRIAPSIMETRRLFDPRPGRVRRRRGEMLSTARSSSLSREGGARAIMPRTRRAAPLASRAPRRRERRPRDRSRSHRPSAVASDRAAAASDPRVARARQQISDETLAARARSSRLNDRGPPRMRSTSAGATAGSSPLPARRDRSRRTLHRTDAPFVGQPTVSSRRMTAIFDDSSRSPSPLRPRTASPGGREVALVQELSSPTSATSARSEHRAPSPALARGDAMIEGSPFRLVRADPPRGPASPASRPSIVGQQNRSRARRRVNVAQGRQRARRRVPREIATVPFRRRQPCTRAARRNPMLMWLP